MESRSMLLSNPYPINESNRRISLTKLDSHYSSDLVCIIAIKAHFFIIQSHLPVSPPLITKHQRTYLILDRRPLQSHSIPVTSTNLLIMIFIIRWPFCNAPAYFSLLILCCSHLGCIASQSDNIISYANFGHFKFKSFK